MSLITSQCRQKHPRIKRLLKTATIRRCCAISNDVTLSTGLRTDLHSWRPFSSPCRVLYGCVQLSGPPVVGFLGGQVWICGEQTFDFCWRGGGGGRKERRFLGLSSETLQSRAGRRLCMWDRCFFFLSIKKNPKLFISNFVVYMFKQIQ